MTARVRSVPLAEARAEARALDARIKTHKAGCIFCLSKDSTCPDADEMRAELAGMRRSIRTWFAPRPDDPTLF